MNIRFETLALTTLVIPEGRLDFSAAAGFEKQLNQVLAGAGTAPAAVIVDCAGLEYVSSAGLRALLLATRAAQRAGISFALCALKPAVQEVFELSGFSRIITVYQDRATALAPAAEACVIERRTKVPSDAAQLWVLTQFLQEFWSAADLSPAQALPFELALEEVFMNVVMHGTKAGALREVAVSLALTRDGLTMTIEDDGPGFDPLSLPAPDVTASLADRRVGGLGVFLVRQMMDSVSYERVAGRNQLRMSKSLTV